MKTERKHLYVLAGVPWLIIAGMIVGAYLPIFRGEKYLLPVKPRDPRDFFRGNYVDLQYDFSNLRAENTRIDLDPAATYRFGDTLYLDLAKKDNVLTAVALVNNAEKVKNIRLKVHPRWQFTGKNDYYDVVAGLESFFAPKKDAEDWEKALREGKVFAEVAIDKSGNARLVRLTKVDLPLQRDN
jgi:uncharacterized membrane-anchored protein